MGKWRGYYAVAFILLLSAVMFILYVPSDASGSNEGITGAMDPEIWIEMESDTYTFNVEPGHVEEGILVGTLFCDFQTGTPRGTQVAVDMIITSNNLGFYGTVQHIFVKGSDEEPVDFTIDLMELTALPADLEYSLTMYPNWYNMAAKRQGMGEEKTIFVEILPYGGVLLIPPNPENFEVGDYHMIDLSIRNTGNSKAKFHVTVDAGDLDLTVPMIEVVIESGKVRNYQIDVKQESGLGKEGDIKVTVTSEIPGDHDTETIFIRYKTHTTVGRFMMRPIPLAVTIASIILIIISMVLLVKKIRGSPSKT